MRLYIASFLAGWIFLIASGCATYSGPRSASGKPVSQAALDAARQRVEAEHIPLPLQPDFIAMYAEGRENFCLYAMRGGLAALRAGAFKLAATTLDLAIQDVEALKAGADAANKAQGKFHAEQNKWFKGESYERSAIFLYRGILYLIEHDYGNAAACFKRTQLYDITGDDAPGFAGDWYSAEWALALAAWKQGFPAEATAALERADGFSTRQGNVPPPRKDGNVMLVIEAGGAPVKYRDGQNGEIMHYREVPSPIRQVEVLRQGRVLATTAPAENLYVQATTRGKRQVDAILAGKAQFKEGTRTAAIGLGMGAVIASHNDRKGIATGVLAGLAILSAGLSAATTPEADIRVWNNLPDTIYFVCLTLPPGATTLTLKGLDAAGAMNRTIELNPVVRAEDPLQVILVRF